MGKLSKYLFGMMAAAMLAGCSDDAIAPDDKDGSKPINGPESSVYMQVTIVPTLGPGGSRSVTGEPDDDGYSTSNSGIEIGQEDENRIYNVMLILAGPENEFISYALIGGLANNNTNVSGKDDEPTISDKEDGKPGAIEYKPQNNSVVVNASFSRASIETFYSYAKDQNFDPTNVYVYALCNYTQDMLNAIKTAKPLESNWTNLSQRIDEYSAASGIPNTGVSVLSTTGGLYMANGVLAPKFFPASAEDWDAFSDEKTPFDLSGINTIPATESSPAAEINNNGSIRVERGMARFDFADGSVYSLRNDWYNANDPSTWNTYIIGDQEDEDGAIQNTLKVKLVRMCLVNMSNRFFYLRHMANTNGDAGQLAAAVLPDDGWTPADPVEALASTFFLCVAEQPWAPKVWDKGNWVIDPYYTFKSTFADIPDKEAEAVHYEDYFNFPLGNRGFKGDGSIEDESWGITPSARDGWYTSLINDVLSGHEDQNFGNWSPDRYDYRIWRYVTENTIPSVAGQKNAISTGIVFKGLLLPGDNCPEDLKAVLTTGSYTYNYKDADGKDVTTTVTNPNLYLYDEVLYVSWINVEAEALAQKAGSPIYNAVYGNTPMTADGKIGDLEEGCAAQLYEAWQASSNAGKYTGAEYDAFRKKIVENGFAIYQHSGEDELDADDAADTESKGGYFCYYYYWNRHNDNSRNGVMGPMEFQVVRNNVYKLAVTEISKIGHPRRTTNDPDPEEPKKDDETSELYFKVQVEVLPWAVRVNNITF